MSEPERVVLSRGRYRLMQLATPCDGGDAPARHRIIDASGAVIEHVASIDTGFLRIEELLAMDRSDAAEQDRGHGAADAVGAAQTAARPTQRR